MANRPLEASNAPAAQDQPWQHLRSALLGFFVARVRNRSEAEDLTQEVCTRFLRRMPSLDSGEAKAYIFTIARNLMKDRARRSFGGPAAANIIDLDFGAAPLPTYLVDQLTPERRLLDREALVQALTLLDGLGKRTCDIFLLFRLEKMTHQEISKLYGISVSAVEKHVAKAVAHLAAGMSRG